MSGRTSGLSRGGPSPASVATNRLTAWPTTARIRCAGYTLVRRLVRPPGATQGSALRAGLGARPARSQRDLSAASRQVLLATCVRDGRPRPQVANSLRRTDSLFRTRRRCARPEFAGAPADDRSIEQMYGERETGLEPATSTLGGVCAIRWAPFREI